MNTIAGFMHYPEESKKKDGYGTRISMGESVLISDYDNVLVSAGKTEADIQPGASPDFASPSKLDVDGKEELHDSSEETQTLNSFSLFKIH